MDAPEPEVPEPSAPEPADEPDALDTSLDNLDTTLDSIVVGDAVEDDVAAALPADEAWSPMMPAEEVWSPPAIPAEEVWSPPAIPADELWSSAKFASTPADPVQPVSSAPSPDPYEPEPFEPQPFEPEPLLSAPPMPADWEFPRPSASARYVAGLGTTPAKPSFTPATPATPASALGSADAASTARSMSTQAPPTQAPPTQAPPTQPPPKQAFPRTGPAAAAAKPGTPAAAARKQPKAPKQPKAAVRKSAARQAHLTIARIEPWSVMKFSFAVSVIAFIILFVVVAILYGLLSAIGVFTSIQHLVSNVTSSSGQSGVNATKWFSASRILGYTVLLGGLNIVLITAISTIGSVIYNLTSRLIGGVEVTLKEAD